MSKIVASISVVPIGTSGTSVSHYVSRTISVVEKMGIHYRVGAGFTDLELDNYRQLASLMEAIEAELAEMGVARIDFFVKVDRRLDADLTIDGKVSKVKVSTKASDH
ncbi:MAG: MTH1187 family thiamine-binding protein [Conexivisphaerales archaeon]|nr:MTH1187 family thiamine-binding protein [Conexivisphaerales archaeon]